VAVEWLVWEEDSTSKVVDCEMFMEESVAATGLVADMVKWEGWKVGEKIFLGCCVAVSAGW